MILWYLRLAEVKGGSPRKGGPYKHCKCGRCDEKKRLRGMYGSDQYSSKEFSEFSEGKFRLDKI